MRDFFKGWKRKAGVVTLVLACVFGSGWIRSLSHEDIVSLPIGQRSYLTLKSDRQCLECDHFYGAGEAIMHAFGHWDLSSERIVDVYPTDDDRLQSANDWDMGFMGFGLGHGSHDLGRPQEHYSDICYVPYWSLVIPLILLSVWLLLSKQPIKQKKDQP